MAGLAAAFLAYHDIDHGSGEWGQVLGVRSFTFWAVVVAWSLLSSMSRRQSMRPYQAAWLILASTVTWTAVCVGFTPIGDPLDDTLQQPRLIEFSDAPAISGSGSHR